MLDELLRCFHCLGCCNDNRIGKKVRPPFPITAQADLVEQFAVIIPVYFEVEARIEHGFLQNVPFAEKQGEQKSSKSSVAAEERMDGFELNLE